MQDLEIFVSGDGLLGLRFFTGSIEQGRLVPWEQQPDEFIVDRYNRVFRDNVEIGVAGGPDQSFILPGDVFDRGPAGDLFVRTNTPDQVSNAAIDRVADWSVTINGEPVAIDDLYRKSKIAESGDLAGFQSGFVQEHVIHLDLGRTLARGDVVSVTSPGGLLDGETVTIDPSTTRSDAVHVNQIGFAPDDPSKIAVLSTWLGVETDRAETGQAFGAGSSGVTYAPGTMFHVVDVATGERLFSDTIELLVPAERLNTDPTNRPATNLAYADTWAMDFSEFDRPGSYVIEVEGIGTSYSFDIGADVWTDLFVTGARGFYHQRSGIALEADYTDWVRPRSLHPDDGQVAVQSTTTILDTANGFVGGRTERQTFQLLEENATGEVIPEAWGGWHDAGDWDRRPQHLEAANQMMELVETNPAFFEGIDLNLPESGNGVPDILDEALWAVDFFQRLQKDNGGVPGGIEGGEDFKAAEASWANSRPLYVYQEDPWSSALFAGSAARAARVVEPYDAERAAQYLADAEAAMDWAIANWLPIRTGTEEARIEDQNLIDARSLAALELYRTTGDPKWEADFLATSSFGTDRPLAYYEHQRDVAYAYLTMDPALQDPEVTARIRTDFLAEAEFALGNFGYDGGFGTTDNPFAPYIFASTATNPNIGADLFVRAHALTGDERFLSAAIEDGNFALGLNPDNISYVSGVGDEQVRELLIGDANALGGDLPPGIVAYGNWDAVGNGRGFWADKAAQAVYPENPANWPGYESWLGFDDAVPITEFTVDEPMGSSVYLWGYLAQRGFEAPEEPQPGGLGRFDGYEIQLGSTATLLDRALGFTVLQLGAGDEATFADGVVASLATRGAFTVLSAVDPEDAYPWARLEIRSDATDIRSWDRIDATYDAENRPLSRDVLRDDGVVDTFVFTDGVRARMISDDLADARAWIRIDRRYDADGVIEAQAADFDDGTTSWTNYAEGVRLNVTRADPEDAFAWDTIYTEYEGGVRKASYRVEDDADVATILYRDGVRERVIFFDGSETRPWETRTITYDGDGAVLDTIFV